MDVAGGLIDALKKAADVLRRHQIPYCLVGGLAVSMHARPRATEDVDFVVLLDEAGTGELEKAFRESFFVVSVSDVMHFPAASIWRIVVRDVLDRSEGYVILDFIIADREEYRRAVSSAVRVHVDGVEIAVATADDLVAMKRLSARPIDILDIEALLVAASDSGSFS